MGSLLQFRDFSQRRKSRKPMKYDRYAEDGVEAPGNSINFIAETSSSCCNAYENIQFSCQVKASSNVNMSSGGIPIKKLIDDEMTKKENVSRSVPSVIARLMGIDALPSQVKSVGSSKGKSNETPLSPRYKRELPRKPYPGTYFRHHGIPRNPCISEHKTVCSMPPNHRREELPKKPHHETYSRYSEPYKGYLGEHDTVTLTRPNHRREEVSINNKDDSSKANQGFRSIKPQRRVHPQEEILQKFKKEFEAWQANKAWEQKKALHANSIRESGIEKLKVAQENPKKEKLVHTPYATQSFSHAETTSRPGSSWESSLQSLDAKQSFFHERTSEPSSSNSGSIFNSSASSSSLRHEGPKWKQFPFSPSETTSSGTWYTDSGYSSMIRSADKSDRTSSPTRIVLLKPGSGNNNHIDEKYLGSICMEDFLAEVREKLRVEIEGNPKHMSATGSTNHMDTQETVAGPSQIAVNIARQIRESASCDIGTRLIPSEISRSYGSDIQYNGSDSPEFINRDARKFLTTRQRNSSRNKEDDDTSSGMTRTSASAEENANMQPFANSKKGEKQMVYSSGHKNSISTKTRSFWEAEETNTASEISPRDFVRSLSAPLSKTACRKVLLEDQNMLVGVNIHEETAKHSSSARKNRKDTFDFKGRVSNLKHNLNLKSKLLGKRMHISKKANARESDCADVVEIASSTVTNLNIPQARLENSTEVPPSPVSESSGSQDDLCKQSHPSPVSPLEVPPPFTEENDLSGILEEVNNYDVPGSFPTSNYEMSSCISTHDIDKSREMETTEDCYEEDAVIEVGEKEEAYVRDALIISGLYQRESIHSKFFILMESPQSLPIWVFEEIEEAFGNKYDKANNDTSSGEASVDHEILFDLVNEALPNVLKPFTNSLGFKKKSLAISIPHGKKLFEDVWSQIQLLMRRPDEEHECSLESLAADDVRKFLRSVMVHEESGGVGAEVELLILNQLVEEFVLELYYE